MAVPMQAGPQGTVKDGEGGGLFAGADRRDQAQSDHACVFLASLNVRLVRP